MTALTVSGKVDSMLWNKSLETNILILDEQHKELFRQIDDVLLNVKKENRITDTLEFLEKYVTEHFQTEELMQYRLNYPNMLAHKKMHNDFALAIQNLRKEYEVEGPTFSMVMKINKIVVDWLKNHIMVQDMDFAEHIRRMDWSS